MADDPLLLDAERVLGLAAGSVRHSSRTDPWVDRLGMFRDNRATAKYAAECKTEHFVLRPNESNLDCWRVSTEFILSTVLQVPKERQTNAQARNVASIMRGFGWATRDFKFGRKTGKGYWKLYGSQS
jgi:hypothetical protein